MKQSICFLLLTFLLLLSSCNISPSQQRQKNWFNDDGKVKVLTTICMIHDVVKEVGAEHVDVLSLVSGELDPHTYQLVKGDDEKFNFADLIFYNGLGLEHGASTREILRNNPKAVGLGDLVIHKHPDLLLSVDGVVDPHIWMDISLWEKTIPFVVEALGQIDPEHADEYQANGNRLEQKMQKAHRQVVDLLQSIPEKKRYLVSSHDAFQYFGRAYLRTPQETLMEDWQARVAAPEGLAPDSQLSTHDIRLIVEHLDRYDICVIFPESNVSRDSIRKIQKVSQERGRNVTIAEIPLYGDAMGPTGSSGDSYLKMIQHNAATLHHYLSS